MNLVSAYRILLRIYPRDYTANFGAAMSASFVRATRERRLEGRVAFSRFLLAELRGLVCGAAAEWFAKWSGDPITRARCLPDIRFMRPVGVAKEDWYR